MNTAERTQALSAAVKTLVDVADELENLHFRARTLLSDVYLTYLQSHDATEARERRAQVGDLFWVLTGTCREYLQ